MKKRVKLNTKNGRNQSEAICIIKHEGIGRSDSSKYVCKTIKTWRRMNSSKFSRKNGGKLNGPHLGGGGHNTPVEGE